MIKLRIEFPNLRPCEAGSIGSRESRKLALNNVGQMFKLPKKQSRSDDPFCSGGFQPADGNVQCF